MPRDEVAGPIAPKKFRPSSACGARGSEWTGPSRPCRSRPGRRRAATAPARPLRVDHPRRGHRGEPRTEMAPEEWEPIAARIRAAWPDFVSDEATGARLRLDARRPRCRSGGARGRRSAARAAGARAAPGRDPRARPSPGRGGDRGLAPLRRQSRTGAGGSVARGGDRRPRRRPHRDARRARRAQQDSRTSTVTQTTTRVGAVTVAPSSRSVTVTAPERTVSTAETVTTERTVTAPARTPRRPRRSALAMALPGAAASGLPGSPERAAGRRVEGGMPPARPQLGSRAAPHPAAHAAAARRSEASGWCASCRSRASARAASRCRTWIGPRPRRDWPRPPARGARRRRGPRGPRRRPPAPVR